MRFQTASGTTYELVDITGGETGPYEGILVRNGLVPIINLETGGEMAEIVGHCVMFLDLPTVGESFRYHLPSHGNVTSTPVTSIEDGA